MQTAMASVLVRYNKSRAIGAIVLPVVAAALMFGPDLASGLALNSNNAVMADGLFLFALVWWTYSLIPGAIIALGYNFNDLSCENGSLRLPEGQEFSLIDIDRVSVESRFLRHPVVTMFVGGRSYTLATAFQTYGQRRSADQIADKISEWIRSARVSANGS